MNRNYLNALFFEMKDRGIVTTPSQEEEFWNLVKKEQWGHLTGDFGQDVEWLLEEHYHQRGNGNHSNNNPLL